MQTEKTENQTDGYEAREKNHLRLISGFFVGLYVFIYLGLMTPALAVTEKKYKDAFSLMLFIDALMISLSVDDFPLGSMTHKGISKAKSLACLFSVCFVGGYAAITYFTGDWNWVFSAVVISLPVLIRVWSIEEMTS